jgi:hypothetical protein
VDKYKTALASRGIVDISKHQGQIDNIIQSIIDDPTYAPFLKTYTLTRRTRSQLKVTEFINQMNKQAAPNADRQAAANTYQLLRDKTNNNIKNLMPTRDSAAIMYDCDFLTSIINDDHIKEQLQAYNPTLHTLLNTLNN